MTEIVSVQLFPMQASYASPVLLQRPFCISHIGDEFAPMNDL
jgi:hypothetical protein